MNPDRYLKIVQWATKRYSKNGVVLWDKGNGTDYPAKKIEKAAFEKYMNRPMGSGCYEY